MLTQPNSKRFVEAIQYTLNTGVRSALGSSDQVAVRDAVVKLQAIDAILNGVIRRIGNEQSWMHEEIKQIEGLAQAIIDQGADNGTIAPALADLRACRSESERVDEIEADYQRASTLLGQCANLALIAGGALRVQLDQVMQSRLDTESHIRGTFVTVGKD